MGLITLTTDFGDKDPYVGVMKGVIFGINPSANIVDITHKVPPQSVRRGAHIIESSFRYFPQGSVHACVIDPGVGTERRPIAFEASGHFFVGPDNGVFSQVLKGHSSIKVHELANDDMRVHPVSNTFHGRDIFAPACAWISKGEPLGTFGGVIDNPVILGMPEEKRVSANLIEGEVVGIDSFGNAISNISRRLFEKVRGENEGGEFEFAVGKHVVNRLSQTYGSVSGEVVLGSLFGSSEKMEFFVKNGSASISFEILAGDHVEVRFY